MKDFKTLAVWEKAHLLTVTVYRATAGFPKEELYGLTSQIRRAASSIPANIAEGCGRGSDADFGRFLQIAMGSSTELEYHLLLSKDLNLLNSSDHLTLHSKIEEVKKMLAAFIKKLKADS
jgi:four helix bundle protein